MDYATTNSGAVTAAPKQKAKAAAQKHSRVPDGLAAQERHRRGTCRPPDLSPCGATAYGFLKNRFLPHYTGQAMAVGNEKEDFYHSFKLLCDHYGISPVDTTGFAYPYGREVVLHDTRRLLREKFPQHIEIELVEDNGRFVLEVNERFNTQNTLFYIPVLPVHKLMRDKKQRKAARLLLCIFHYLYHSAGVPSYTDQSSYLYWNYEMLSDWVTDDPEGWDAEDYHSNLNAVRAAKYIGDTLMRRLWNTSHRERFGEWVADYQPNNSFERDCHRLAKKFYALSQEYPKASLYDHADRSCLPEPESDYYDDNECVTIEKYIGFVASTEGWLYNHLEQNVNSEFGECVSIQEPVLNRCFDGQKQDSDTLDFECRLFPLINELCYLLNNRNYDN